MGYYYDWIDAKWERINHERKLTRQIGMPIRRRAELIERLLTEIDEGDHAVTTLYASLLARALIKTDELLMREYGERVVNASPEECPRRAA